MPQLILIGLGPGDPALLTRAAWDRLNGSQPIYTPTPQHLALAHLDPALLFALPTDPAHAAATVRTAMHGPDPVVCALPGDPLDHPIGAALADVGPTIIPGMSLIDAYCRAAGIGGRGTGLQVLPLALLFHTGVAVDAATAAADPAWSEMQHIGAYTPLLTPYPLRTTQPALLIMHEASPGVAPVLLQRYPADTPLTLVQLDAQGNRATRTTVALHELEATLHTLTPAAIAIPALPVAADQRGIDGLTWVVARLLGPGGCPWDRKQTHQTLRQPLLEETYEVIEALDAGDMAALPDELGDLLLQVILHSEMARQAGNFDLGDVLTHITSKLIRRHPHVFGNVEVTETGEVLQRWEAIKARELAEKGRARNSALDGIPPALPALASTQKLMKKAARVGFEWPNMDGAWAKFREEIAELEEACQAGNDPQAQQAIAEELGDVFFTLVNIARWLQLDAETVLREAGHKFRRRFQAIESMVAAEGRSLAEYGLEEQLALWKRAKQLLKA